MAAPPDRLLSKRQLNRALLARQLLLAREPVTPVAAIERLAGLQAQLARPPFIGLWSRLARFTRDDLLKVLHARTVIRVTAMRGTLHLISARDYLGWRGPLQPALDRGITSIVGAALAEIDMPAAERAPASCSSGRPPPSTPSATTSRPPSPTPTSATWPMPSA